MHAKREGLQAAAAPKDGFDLGEREARLVASFLNDQIMNVLAESGTSAQEGMERADARAGVGLDFAKHDLVVEGTEATAQRVGGLLLAVCERKDALQELVRQFREAVDAWFGGILWLRWGRARARSQLGRPRTDA